jgi:hypothetical protein
MHLSLFSFAAGKTENLGCVLSVAGAEIPASTSLG